MGLAIPRPTRLPLALARLGDPRSSFLLVRASCISVALGCGNGKLLRALQQRCNDAAASIGVSISFLRLYL